MIIFSSVGNQILSNIISAVIFWGIVFFIIIKLKPSNSSKDGYREPDDKDPFQGN